MYSSCCCFDAGKVGLLLVLHPHQNNNKKCSTICRIYFQWRYRYPRYAHEPAAARRSERLNRSTSTAMGLRSPLSAAQVASGLRIEPSQPREAHSRHTNARPRRSHVVAAARNSKRHVSEVSQQRVSRTTAVGRSGSCATRRGTGRDPGPCSPCTAATSRAVDAHICCELGSHTKPGLHTRCLPQRAVSSPQLKPWRFAIARRIGSTYPCTSR